MEERALGGKTLASLYLVSGLTKDVKMWSMSDTDAMRRVQPIEDSLGCFWRPEVLGKSWPGQEKSSTAGLVSSPSSAGVHSSIISSMSRTPEIATPSMMKVIAKALKMSHLKEVEIVNAELAPPASTHIFTFLLPKEAFSAGLPSSLGRRAIPNTHTPGGDNTQWHGVCLTVWTQADPERSRRLTMLKDKLKKLVDAGSSVYGFDNGVMIGTGSTATITPLARMSQASLALSPRIRGRKPSNMRIRAMSGYSSAGNGDDSDSVISESDLEGAFGANLRGLPASRSRLHRSFVADVAEEMAGDAGALFEKGEERFWIPYALTLVSRYPVYEIMGDFLKLSWARFSKDFASHTRQISRILSYPSPRAGQSLRLPTGLPGEEDVELCGEMPGGGVGPSIDLRAWILFAMLPLDTVLTTIEFALSNNGKVVIVSKVGNAVGQSVVALHSMLKPYRWSGITMPLLHARDVSMVLDAPAPLIIGLHADIKDVISIPDDALCLDLDTHQLTLHKHLHEGVVSKGTHREKFRSYLIAALGPDRPQDHGIPTELKLTYSNGKMRPTCTVNIGHRRPVFLGEDLRVPKWWNGLAIRQALDRIGQEKAKKPGFFQKLLSCGPPKPEAPLTTGELSAKDAMRQRALAAVESRDLVELKLGRINRRLIHLVQEGDIHLVQEGEIWKRRFEEFETFTEKLGTEALELKTKIEKEKREAKRLSGMVSSKQQENSELQDRLQNTERAREQALLKLSDMAANMQALELERDTIVDSIEHRLENVMSTLEETDSSDLDSRADDEEPSSSRATGRKRSGTGHSSVRLLQATAASSPLGVLDAADGKEKEAKRFSLITMDDGKDNPRALDAKTLAKSEFISERMAKIQRKLDAALEAVSAHRLSANDYTENHADPADGVADSKAKKESKQNKPDASLEPPAVPKAGDTTLEGIDTRMPASLSSRTLVNVPVSRPAPTSKIHKVGSHSVLATITTVITMDDHAQPVGTETADGTAARGFVENAPPGTAVHQVSTRPRGKKGKAASRVSLLPPAGSGDYHALVQPDEFRVQEDQEYLDGEDLTDEENDRGGQHGRHSKVSPDHKAGPRTQHEAGGIGRPISERSVSDGVPSLAGSH